MIKLFKSAALAAATASVLVAAAPATAANLPAPSHVSVMNAGDAGWNNWRRDDYRRDRYDARYSDRGYYNDRGRYNNNRQIWRGRDGRYYCRRDNGTTGLLIGGAVGGLIGHEVAGRGDNTLGTILGVAGGALLGREIDRSGSRCR